MSGTKIKGYDTIVVYEWNEWGKSGGGILAKYKISIHLQSVLFPCSLKINTHWSLFFILSMRVHKRQIYPSYVQFGDIWDFTAKLAYKSLLHH